MEKNIFFPEVNGKLGFGCMRFPMNGERIDEAQVAAMVDLFLARGFNYFDTAHGYHGGLSETTLKACLTSRYPRKAYLLTNKLSTNFFEKTDEIRPLFEKQLTACGVDYFDFYLMHAQDHRLYEKYQRLHAYETAYAFKKEGLIRHFGLSFHDRAELLDRILTEHPEIDAVQIQFNYVDYDDPSVESRKCYDVCVKHHKPVIVMEPIKGGSLINLPEEAQKILDNENSGSNASFALRFVAGFEQIFMVLSGMSSLEQMEENTAFMRDCKPLSASEQDAIKRVTDVLRRQNDIPCTVCRYCTERCPKGIHIPDLFALYNAKRRFHNWNSDYYYSIHSSGNKKASDCLACGRCEEACPQHLPIRSLLKDVAKEFEKHGVEE